MVQITVVNSTDQSAELVMSKGGGGKALALSGRIPVAADTVVIVPPVKAYTAYASVTLDDNDYITNTVHLPDPAWRLTARIERAGELFSFELVGERGEVPERMTLVNTVDAPTVFAVDGHAAGHADDPILTSRWVVEPRDRVEIGTGEAYAFYAIVNGVTTDTVMADPRPGQDVTVQIVSLDDGMPGLVLVEPA